ncbi:MAG: Gfo/Idh/MocA family oxidoreductase [Candidatus Brocadiaceae bacterium]|jgi:predicted dehydrogenase
MGQTLRMGYVGCGFMAQKVHIPNIRAVEDCELAALAEVRPELLSRCGEFFGVEKLYPSHAELAEDPDIDAVAVSGHYSRQGEIAIDLLRAGKDVFMEKPMATSLAQGERIVAAERESAGRLMIAYMKRYDAGNVAVKRLLDEFQASGELGAIQYARNHGFCGDWIAGLDTPMVGTDEPKPEAETTWPEWLPESFRRGYIGYLQQYTHNVNLLRWFLDAGPDAEVRAVDLDEDGMTGVVVMEMAGRRALIESGSIPYPGWEEHTQIYFDRGWVKTCAPPLLLKNVCATVEVYRGDQPEKPRTELFPPDGRSWSYREEMKHFVQCVLRGKPFRSPAADALEDVRLLEEIYRRHVGQRA